MGVSRAGGVREGETEDQRSGQGLRAAGVVPRGWPGAEHWSADPHLPHLSHPLLPRRWTQAFMGLGVSGHRGSCCPEVTCSPSQSCRVGCGPVLRKITWLLPACLWTAPIGPSMPLVARPSLLAPFSPSSWRGSRAPFVAAGDQGPLPAIDLTSLPSLSTPSPRPS